MLASSLHYTLFSYCVRKSEMFILILSSLNFLEELIEIYTTILGMTLTGAILEECNYS